MNFKKKMFRINLIVCYMYIYIDKFMGMFMYYKQIWMFCNNLYVVY